MCLLDAILADYTDHSSIVYMRNHMSEVNGFNFKPVSQDDVFNILKRLNTKKTTGCDNISPKVLQVGATVICKPLAAIVNKCLLTSSFPDELTFAKVLPVFKKNNAMDKRNCRAISILPTVSKVLEKIILQQLTPILDKVASPHLSGFRKNYSCQMPC